MTKKDIVKTISWDTGMTQLHVKEIVQRTFDEIIETLVRDGKIELRNFGVFKVTKRAARPARNPRTGDRVNVPEKLVVTFKAGKEMEDRVRQLGDVPDNVENTQDAPELVSNESTHDTAITPSLPDFGDSDSESSFSHFPDS
ncbi:MAG: HU family DNA-binding protein [Planctomycetaceae bacterium]